MTVSIQPQHVAAVQRGARCDLCPLHGCHAGPVPSEIRPGSKLIVVDECPDSEAVELGVAQTGTTRDFVNGALFNGTGLEQHQVSTTNAILCRPPGGHMLDYAAGLKKTHKKTLQAAKKKGKKAVAAVPQLFTPQDCCYPRLARDIEESGAQTLTTLGSESLKSVAHHLKLPYATKHTPPGKPRVAALKKQHGAPVVAEDGRILIASLHPKFIAFGSQAQFLPVVRSDLQRAASISMRPGRGMERIYWTEPSFILKPSFETCIAVIDAMRVSKARVTVDIETDGIIPTRSKIRCIGQGAVLEGKEVIIVIPVRHMSGQAWWSDSQESQLGRALLRMMDESPLCGSNLLFDTAVLLAHGFMSDRLKSWMDDMIAHHNTDQSELPHDLGFMSARAFEAPRWKDDADHKATSGVDDYYLHLYCMARGTPVVMADGSTRLIEELVRTRSTEKVLALKNGKIVERHINGWHLNRVEGQKWVNIRVARQRESARGIVCTPDHRIWTQRGWVEAAYVRVGDKLSTPESRLAPVTRQAILGTLLGDSTVGYSPAFRARRAEAPETAIQGGHTAESGLAQLKVYTYPELFMLRDDLPAHEVTVNGRKGLAEAYTPYGTLQRQEFAELGRLVQDQGRRRLRVEALEQLGPAGMAWWFMDDGCLQKGQRCIQNNGKRGGKLYAADTLVISTQRYSREDLDAAGEWLSKRFGGTVKAHKDGVLRFSRPASVAFAQYVAPFIFPKQRYKLPRDVQVEAFNPKLYGPALSPEPVEVEVTEVRSFEHGTSKSQQYIASQRYCLDVEDAHNFFTPWGLVHNCGKDVLGEMRLQAPLIQRMMENDTVKSFATDTALAPVARDMGDLGLNLNEKTRHKNFEVLEVATKQRAAEVRAVVGRADFNPNAFKQVAKYLYVERGLAPPYATDGSEWEDLIKDAEEEGLDFDPTDAEDIVDLASTNELSLLRLLDLGVDAQTRKFVESLLWYRGLEKCKSTYVGLKRDAETGEIIDTHRKSGNLLTESHGSLTGEHFTNLSVFHPSWKTHVTPTGRWSARAQNWPERVVFDVDAYKDAQQLILTLNDKDPEQKKRIAQLNTVGILNSRGMVEAPEGYVLVGADYAAIELRIYAIKAKDTMLINAIWPASGKKEDELDPHALNYASMMSRHPSELMMWYERVKKLPPNIKKYKRNIAKRFAFLVIYGGQKAKLFLTMTADRNPDGSRAFPDLKPSDVDMWWDNWQRMHPQTKRWQEAAIAHWQRYGYAKAILDERKRFFLGGLDPQAIPNHEIQGSAGAIMNRAMIQIAKRCPYRGWGVMAGPILQVHDFAGLQVPLSRQADAERILDEEMPYMLDGYPIVIERKSGKSWDKI